ncbi:MAG: isochorismatase family protein [Verrucomicrobiota bacterium]
MHHTLHSPGSIALLVVDVQERLVRAMGDCSDMLAAAARMVRIANRLEVPVIVTEQYPRGLGSTVSVVGDHVPDSAPVFAKTSFSCFGCPAVSAELERYRPETLVIAGIEAHVCVQQTALDALARGFHVAVLADAVQSRNLLDRDTALALLRSRGVTVSTVEALAFALLRDAEHPAFKDISRIVVEN